MSQYIETGMCIYCRKREDALELLRFLDECNCRDWTGILKKVMEKLLHNENQETELYVAVYENNSIHICFSLAEMKFWDPMCRFYEFEDICFDTTEGIHVHEKVHRKGKIRSSSQTVKDTDKRTAAKPEHPKKLYDGTIIGNCPNCGRMVSKDREENFCPRCGKAICWKEVDL